MLLLSSADFFQNELFRKILSGTLSESVLIWVQTVCKGYQQMTKGAASKDLKRVKIFIIGFFHGNHTV